MCAVHKCQRNRGVSAARHITATPVCNFSSPACASTSSSTSSRDTRTQTTARALARRRLTVVGKEVHDNLLRGSMHRTTTHVSGAHIKQLPHGYPHTCTLAPTHTLGVLARVHASVCVCLWRAGQDGARGQWTLVRRRRSVCICLLAATRQHGFGVCRGWERGKGRGKELDDRVLRAPHDEVSHSSHSLASFSPPALCARVHTHRETHTKDAHTHAWA